MRLARLFPSLKPSTSISRFSQSCVLLARRSEPPSAKREIRFSETAAYAGIDRVATPSRFTVEPSTWQPDYYSTNSYRHKRLLSALISLVVVIVYFGWLREPNDLDVIINAPPHLLSANLERRILKDEIERAKKAGKDTTLLEAELDYVAVKEAAMKAQFGDNKK